MEPVNYSFCSYFSLCNDFHLSSKFKDLNCGAKAVVVTGTLMTAFATMLTGPFVAVATFRYLMRCYTVTSNVNAKIGETFKEKLNPDSRPILESFPKDEKENKSAELQFKPLDTSETSDVPKIEVEAIQFKQLETSESSDAPKIEVEAIQPKEPDVLQTHPGVFIHPLHWNDIDTIRSELFLNRDTFFLYVNGDPKNLDLKSLDITEFRPNMCMVFSDGIITDTQATVIRNKDGEFTLPGSPKYSGPYKTLEELADGYKKAFQSKNTHCKFQAPMFKKVAEEKMDQLQVPAVISGHSTWKGKFFNRSAVPEEMNSDKTEKCYGYLSVENCYTLDIPSIKPRLYSFALNGDKIVYDQEYDTLDDFIKKMKDNYFELMGE